MTTPALLELAKEWRERVHAIGRDTGSYRICADELEKLLTAQPAEGVMVDCSAIPKHQWEPFGEPEPITYSDELIGCWERCRQCGLKRHVTREKVANCDKPEIDHGSQNEQAFAWQAVIGALNEATGSRDWICATQRGVDSAVLAIRELAKAKPASAAQRIDPIAVAKAIHEGLYKIGTVVMYCRAFEKIVEQAIAVAPSQTEVGKSDLAKAVELARGGQAPITKKGFA